MADTTFVDNVLTAANRVVAAWLNTINNYVYRGKRPTYAETTGAANTYLLTIASSLFTSAGLTAGDTFLFRAHQTNSGAATFSVAGNTTSPATAIQKNGAALTGNEIVDNGIYSVTWDGAAWQLHGLVASPLPVSLGGTGAVTAAAAATALGLGTGDSPLFAAVSIGNADTTITRTGAGDIAVEGNAIYRAGGTDVPVADGGTGGSTAAAARSNLNVMNLDAALYTYDVASGTGGGNSTGGAWTTRPLNTEVYDAGSIGVLSVNQITLQAGTYEVSGGMVAVSAVGSAGSLTCRFRNVTDGATVALGVTNTSVVQNAGTNNATSTQLPPTRFTIAGAKVFELQYWVASALATSGLGQALTTGENERYAWVMIRKID